MKIRKSRCGILLFISCVMLLLAHPVEAANQLLPEASDNLKVSLRSTSELTAVNNGYMRVFYDGEKVCIEYYDDNFEIQSKKSINMELSIWGGFYAGSDGYYLVEGQSNAEEIDAAEVIRVIKYDFNWNKIGTARITSSPDIFGGEVKDPFDYGCVEMTEYNGTLYIVTGHEGYVDQNAGQGHQGFLMIAVDQTSMTGSIVDGDFWHSFAQYIDRKDSNLYVLEQSEGSRYTKLTRYNGDNLQAVSIPVLAYGGSHFSPWAIACYASVDDMAISADNVLCLGTSIDQSKYDDVTQDTEHNIYLTVTSLSDFSEEGTTVKWLTNYSGGGKCFMGTKLTKINDNRFLVTWEENDESGEASVEDGLSSGVLNYVFIDGAGNKISQEFTASAPISDCVPIVKDSRIVYYASNATTVDFYTIDAETGAFSKKVYRVAGEHATWKVEEGVLIISGTGDLSLDMESQRRYPVSFISGFIAFSSSDNGWKSVREEVTKLVVESGITSISQGAFAFFNNLTEVEIKSGVKSIGERAFYGCEQLEKITIPSSVKSIGEDILWTGYTWIGSGEHVVKAVIYTPENSYAMKYAEKNGIYYEISGKSEEDTNIANGKVTGLKTSYVYTGKAQQPQVTVKLSGKTLKKGTDYRVSYTNNRKTGKAKIKITGIGSYQGTITKTFYIVPKKAVLMKTTSPKAKTLKVSWKKDVQADGYQIQYAENRKFTKGKKKLLIEKRGTISKRISNLKRKKKYFVRVRAYKIIDGKKCYGAWSKSKTVTCR